MRKGKESQSGVSEALRIAPLGISPPHCTGQIPLVVDL